MHLTPEQIQLFRHNGFIKLPTQLSEETVQRLRETVWKHIREEIQPVVRDRQGRVVRLSNLWDRDEIFRETLTCAEVLEPLQSLLGANIELIKNRHNHATLRLDGDGTDYLHRDVLQWSRNIVTVIFYLVETTVENGCTFVIPGTHLMPHVSTHRLSVDEENAPDGILEQAVPVPMPAGGMLAIDSTIIHGGGRNFTRQDRMSMTVGYHSVDELSGMENPKRVLVCGERIYMGNDKR
jgi:ectoine hydroxylase-related dioxygenase (phytanoyl-CoA dioxygenase family)